MTDRTCGGCTACCFTHQISSIGKWSGVWCKECTVGTGCAIYDTKPLACSSYRCGWLKGMGTDADKPDKTNVVYDVRQLDLFFGAKVLEISEAVKGASSHTGIQALIMDHLAKRGVVTMYACVEKTSACILGEGVTLPRDKRRMLKGKNIPVLTAAEYAAQQKSSAE